MSTPLPWITDRLPTEADGDATGYVVIRLDHGQWDMTEWYNVPESTPWLAFKPAVEDGQRRRIISIAEVECTTMAVADDGTAWYLSADWSSWTQLPELPKSEG